jgi:hypothetical protein
MVHPVHPRTRTRLQDLGLSLTASGPIELLGFLEFLQRSKGLALADLGGGPGGGVHSGSSGVTLRENTERPEIRWKWGRCTGWS